MHGKMIPPFRNRLLFQVLRVHRQFVFHLFLIYVAPVVPRNACMVIRL